MESIRLLGKDDRYYAPFRELYEISFPVFEQRTHSQQEQAFASSRYHLDVYCDGGVFTGFASYWVWDDYVYLEHLAICPERRGGGYGGRILTDLSDRYARRVLLEIDPLIDDISAARLRFYEKHGFFRNSYTHVHPPYRDGYPGHDLIVLTTNGGLSKAGFEQFGRDLCREVMNFSPDRE